MPYVQIWNRWKLMIFFLIISVTLKSFTKQSHVYSCENKQIQSYILLPFWYYIKNLFNFFSPERWIKFTDCECFISRPFHSGRYHYIKKAISIPISSTFISPIPIWPIITRKIGWIRRVEWRIKWILWNIRWIIIWIVIG